MRTIKIGNKQYPFILSAAAAKEYFSNGLEKEGDDVMSIAPAVRLIHKGMTDASLTKSWWKRNISERVPSETKLSRLLEVSEIMEVVQNVFPQVQSEKSKEGVDAEKK